MIYLLIFLCVTSLLVLAPSKRAYKLFAGISVLVVSSFSTWMALAVLISPQGAVPVLLDFIHENISPLLICDKLSAFFIIVINFTVISGYIYSLDYLRPYEKTKPAVWMRIHYLAFNWLHISMILVPLLRNSFWFLVVWEIMTLTSFVLVIFSYDSKGTIKAGMSYLIQMHVGMFLILAAFIISSSGVRNLSFDNLHVYFQGNPNWPVFLLFFLGFGLKAGFFLMHTWLPDAHPAAPSHVSGIMSGVMIKLGIYGILRVTTYLSSDFTAIGASVIIISGITGLFGVMMAILQHDVKKLLAYHSIENIGIIGMGIGLGIYGTAIGSPIVSTAGYAGALLHTLNHSLFKSLLFYSAGSVIGQVHTQNIEKMGGLMKYMPFTAWAFLIGAIAISGIPPFNGFISEFLIYTSLLKGFSHNEFYSLILLFITMFALVLIGGLALLCFTKVFSVVFLGQPRSAYPVKPAEASKKMLFAKALPVLPVVLIGLLPFLIVKPLLNMTGSIFPAATAEEIVQISEPMKFIALGSSLLILLVISIVVIRKILFRHRVISLGPTWGCGYTAVDAKQQYTATSFIQEYATLSRPIIKTGYSRISYPDDEIFPEKRDFHTHTDDFVRSRIIYKPADFIINLLKRAAVFQTGKLQHYVLYVLVFLLMILILTFLKII
jgi:hydrogenase-4 component B